MSTLQKQTLNNVNWELTYACQLRCTHCCTESGRRASAKLPRERLLEIADLLAGSGVKSVQLTGGEPLLVPELFEIAERLRRADIELHLYTNGIAIPSANASELVRLFTCVHVSMDGPSASVHDPIRGRAGSFDACMAGLAVLDEAATRAARPDFWFGVDCTVIQSNFPHLEAFCTDVVSRFPSLKFMVFGAGIPSGLATRRSFAERELLGPGQLSTLRDAAFAARLQAAAPSSVRVIVTDNFVFQMHPQLVREGNSKSDALEIGPEGGVRGMIIYEGVVGNILEDSLDVICQRAEQRFNDPFVLEVLSGVKTMIEWAEAARQIDMRFASEADRKRIASRADHTGHPDVRSLPRLRSSRAPSIETKR
jgi:uncharacterized Fe-S cluster-containing radical SAM superfamily protein